MKPNARVGLTLAEMLVVIAVLSMLVIIAVPSLVRSMQAATAQGAASTIAADVEAAFAAAARSRRPVVLSCDCVNRTYQVADQADATVRMERRLDGSAGIDVAQLIFASTSGSSVVIGPNGLATDGFAFDVTVGGSTRTVSVSRTGQVRVLR